MPPISGNHVLEGLAAEQYSPGTPSAGTNAVQTLSETGTPTGGTFKLAFDGYTTAAIAYNASAATVAAALVALPNVGTSGFAGTGGALPTDVVLTAGGNLAKLAISVITVANNSLTGGTSPAMSIANTTPGVTAFARGASKGVTVSDTTNGLFYQNTGTALVPVWTKVGTQT